MLVVQLVEVDNCSSKALGHLNRRHHFSHRSLKLDCIGDATRSGAMSLRYVAACEVSAITCRQEYNQIQVSQNIWMV
jgi:hypothetical protein